MTQVSIESGPKLVPVQYTFEGMPDPEFRDFLLKVQADFIRIKKWPIPNREVEHLGFIGMGKRSVFALMSNVRSQGILPLWHKRMVSEKEREWVPAEKNDLNAYIDSTALLTFASICRITDLRYPSNVSDEAKEPWDMREIVSLTRAALGTEDLAKSILYPQ